MTEVQRIADQLRRSYEGQAWHGPSLTEVLAGVTPEKAAAKPLPGIHSIWEIVRHVTSWAAVARRTVEGEAYPVRLAAPADWPEATNSWPAALAELDREEKALIEAVMGMTDARLEETVTERKGYTFYVLLHGVVQHNLYHAGQVMLLKKLMLMSS